MCKKKRLSRWGEFCECIDSFCKKKLIIYSSIQGPHEAHCTWAEGRILAHCFERMLFPEQSIKNGFHYFWKLFYLILPKTILAILKNVVFEEFWSCKRVQDITNFVKLPGSFNLLQWELLMLWKCFGVSTKL